MSVNEAIIGLNNGLLPVQPQAIIWTNAGLLLNGPLEMNFTEIFIEIWQFSVKNIKMKMLSARCQPFCLCLNVLTDC